MINFNQVLFEEDPEKIILQFDSEGRREAGFLTIEIENFKEFLQALESAIDENLNQGYVIYGLDFSNSNLENDKLAKIVDFLIQKIKTISFLNLYQSQTDACDIENHTTKLPQLMGFPDKDLNWLFDKEIIFEMPCAYYYGKK